MCCSVQGGDTVKGCASFHWLAGDDAQKYGRSWDFSQQLGTKDKSKQIFFALHAEIR